MNQLKPFLSVSCIYVCVVSSFGYDAGPCAAGFLCLAGSEDYTPNDIDPDPMTGGPCVANEPCAGACPAGYFCPEGSEVPTPCPEHTLRASTGAMTVDDCVPCPAGYWCHEG